MELLFLGRGAAFNTKEGNTSAYFIDNKHLFIIDCGESIFERIIEGKLLDNIDEVYLMITHTHSDHIGSIGSLVMYCFYILNKQVNIILPSEAKYLSNIENILNGFGCTKEMYKYVDEDYFDEKYTSFKNIRYIETRHSDNLNCYGIIFNTDKGIVYYSGDTNEIDIVKNIVNSNQLIDKLYVDTTTLDYPENVHLYIGLLEDTIKKELRSHVYCMHLNSDNCIEQAEELGFNVVKVLK